MKYLNYLKYVIRHRWFVFLECCKLGVPWRGLVHDLSKFLPSEFFPYAEFFYGKRGSDQRTPEHIDTAFDLSWLMHQKRNPHHWQYWMRFGDDGTTRVFEMPEVYIREMVADWKGAGKAITGKDDAKGWYLKNKDKMQLDPQTRLQVEVLLGIAL